MIPVLTSAQVKEADAYTIKEEPISSLELMERAIDRLIKQLPNFKNQNLHIICGTGNNAADGLVLARKLSANSVNCKVSITNFGTKFSNEFDVNLKKLKETKLEINFIETAEQLAVRKNEIVIDAIFGNGLSRTIEGEFKKLVEIINSENNTVFSIDMPSGLLSEGETSLENFIHVYKAFVFECPRPALLNEEHKVEFELVDIGLDKKYISSLETDSFLIEETDAEIPARPRFSYKNTFGHLLVIGGSEGMFGAPVLSSLSAFKSGAGMVTCAIPQKGTLAVYSNLPEAMILETGEDKWENELIDLSRFSACAIGMGLGRDKKTFDSLRKFLISFKNPVIIDADALNMIAENKALSIIPANSVLTPHLGEFRRLVGEWKSEKEKLEKLKRLSSQTKSVVVLKGTYTVIAEPQGKLFYNTIGSPSLATAGSGDVLSGIIGALLAQGYSELKSAISGVYHHGRAGKRLKGAPSKAQDIIKEIVF